MTTHCYAGETVNKIFIEQPDPLDLCDLNGKTIFLRWKAQYELCYNYPIINIKTMNYTLHPDDNRFVLDRIKEESNVTAKDECISGKTYINVTLSIHLSEYILEHVPYVVCIITRSSTEGGPSDRSKNLYLEANRNCSRTTTDSEKQSTDFTNVNITTIVDPSELSQSTINYAYCVHCNGSLKFMYHVLFVFITILLAVH